MNFKTLKKAFYGLLFFVLLTSCSYDFSSEPSNDNETSQSNIRLGDPSDLESRMGRDFNRSGVRDDVEEWIDSLNYDPYENGEYLHQALLNLAEKYQSELASAHSLTKSREATLEVVRATDCLYSLVGPEVGKPLRDRLRERVFNNADRREWREVILKNFEGQSVPELGNISPRRLCDFID